MRSIRQKGLLPNTPTDMSGEKRAVYLFKNREDVEDAVMNWLGDIFKESEQLVLLTINKNGVNVVPSEVDYEVLSLEPISPDKIINVEVI